MLHPLGGMTLFPGSRFLLGCLILVITCWLVASNNLLSSTFDVQTTNMIGNTYRYAVFEAQFQEEIHVMRQWTCGCVNATVPCSLSPTASQTALVDETGYAIQSLVEGSWLSGSIESDTESKHYKFELSYNLSRPCPMIILELDNDLGTLSMLVSNVEIPNTASRMWLVPYYGMGSFVICPSHPNMTYGTYYITMENQYGKVYNSYRLRYSVVNSPTCLANPPSPTVTSDSLDSVWVSDGIEHSGTVEEGSSAYLRLLTHGPCTNVSASVYNWDGSGDLDIFASATHPYPQPYDKTSFQWHASLEGDDSVNFYYCNPDLNQTTNVFYFGIRGVTSGHNSFSFFATSQQYSANPALSDFGMVQFTNVLSYGATPFLTCSDRHYSCGYTPYSACDMDRAYDCCYIFSPLAAIESVQTVWPWSEWDDSINVLSSEIPWSDSTPVVPGKLAWKLYLSRESKRSDGTGYSETLSHSDPSTCTLTLNTNIVDSAGKPLREIPISFTPKPKTCDYKKLKESRQKLVDLSNSLIGQTDILRLGLQQSRLAIASLEPSISACEGFIDDLTTATTSATQFDVSYCRYLDGTAEWEADPCCNPVAAVDVCCASRPIFETQIASRKVDASKIKSTCRSHQCVQGAVDEYSTLSVANEHATKGCAANFNAASSIDALTSLTSFIDGCRVELVGKDLLGSTCQSDADCFYGRSCNSLTLRCNHNDDDVIDCLAKRMDAMTATILFNTWGIAESVTEARMVSELTGRIKTSQCEGSPNAIRHREGYSWTPYIDGCTDKCGIENRAPFCFDRMSPACVIDPDCDGAQVSGACYRFWAALEADPNACLAEQICNWRSCPTDGSDCSAACLNPSPYSTHTCLDCSGSSGQCLQVDGIDSESRCSLGLCSTNASVTSSSECVGSCSINCSTCNNDQATCEANGACSDIVDILEKLQLANPSGSYETGACIYKPSFSIDSNAWVCEGSDILAPNGCVNVSVESQSQCASQWYQYANGISECFSESRFGCFDTVTSTWLALNETECSACTSSKAYAWTAYFTWTNGTWTNGVMKPLQWSPRRYYAPNSLKQTIDYSLLFSLIKSAVTSQFALSYYTEAQCRYSVPLQLVEATLCDCTARDINPTKCFAAANDISMGKGRACPFLASSFSTRSVTVHVGADSIPVTSGCQVVQLGFTAASQYKLADSSEVSQALFRDSPTNSYWVVTNSQNANIGQIISGGIKIDIPVVLNEPLVVCIEPDSSIDIASFATQRAVASLSSNSEISPLAVNAFVSEHGRICTEISKSGTYFATAVVERWATQTNRVSVAQYRVGAALYLACFVFGVVQMILLLRDWKRQRILSFKITFIVIILINNLIRAIYVLLPANTFRNGLDSIQFIVFELPTFLYFSVFTVIIYMWLLVVMKAMLWARRGEVSRRERQLRLGFILANTVMYAVFVVFIYIIAIVPQTQKQSPCFIGSSDAKTSSVTYKIKLGYWIFQFVVAVLVSAGFVAGAILLVKTFWKSGVNPAAASSTSSGSMSYRKPQSRHSRYATQIAIISTVAVVCMVFMLIRAALFLWAAKTSKSLNVIVFVLLEVIPQAMLLFYVHPFRCFREEGVSSSSKGTKSTNSSIRDTHLSSVVTQSNASSEN